MLQLLRIRNFAIIDELELEFHSGFNAITGETGAGKSIVLDAIGVILGNRAQSDLIRTGFDEATVEAVFSIASQSAFSNKCIEFGLKFENEILIKRTIHRSGKNKIYCNGELITLHQLSSLCEDLVDLCSQHEHQSLAKPVFQLEMLDRFGGLNEKKHSLKEVFSELKKIYDELTKLTEVSGEAARSEDFLRFQLSEIDEFDPKPEEEESLLNERKKLVHASSLIEAISTSLNWLCGSNTDGNECTDVKTLLSKTSQKITKALSLDDSLGIALQAIERTIIECDEAIHNLNLYSNKLENDPARLEVIEQRLNHWKNIKKKYGVSYSEIMLSKKRISDEIDSLSHKQEYLDRLETKKELIKNEYQSMAEELSKKRKNVAKTLQKNIQSELSELMMPETRFTIEITKETNEGPDGIDRAQFLFSANPGEDLKPVSKIASGGELSRVMLAIRRTIADRGGIGVYLFDEIDAGIGGQTASIVGKKLKSVSKYNQVICITHLPQVAAYADAHFSVIKKIDSGRTVSQVEKLSQNKRIDEMARMLGGLNVTEKSRAHARDLLNEAR